MKFTPQGEKILLRKKLEQYEGLIVIPDTAKKHPPVEGEVVAIGSMVSEFAKAGDTVVFGKYAGVELNDADMIGDNEYVVIHEGDIMYKKEHANGRV